MTTPTRFHGEPVRERTKIKLKILEWFLKPWIAKLGTYARKAGQSEIWFVDLFAGQGELVDGSAGSSLIAAKSSLLSLNESTTHLSIFACESDPAAFLRLREGLAHFEGIPVTCRPGSWLDNADEISAAISGKPALLFVDPFGFKDIQMNKLLQIARRASAVDVLIKLEDEFVQRFAGESPSVLNLASGTEAWQRDFPWNGTSADKTASFANAVCASVAQGISTSRSRGKARHYQIEARSLTRTVHFTLVMASRNMQALRLFTDAVAKTVKQRALHTGGGEQIDLFDRRTSSEKRFQELKDGILRFLEARQRSDASLSYEEILDHAVLRCPFVFETREVTAALRSLHLQDRTIRKLDLSPGYTTDRYTT